MRLDAGTAFALGWRIIPKLPEPFVRWAFDLVFRLAWRRGAAGARQLERNLSRVVPDATDQELSRLTRQGMREYGRYYAETFMQPRLEEDELRARASLTYPDRMAEDLRTTGVVAALGHTGNWDMAGAWVAGNLCPLVTVAEVLEPERIYREFLALRRARGVDIIPLRGGGEVFRKLIRWTREHTGMVALLADRDLTSGGVEVHLCGQPARFAVGPAALALTTKRPLYFVGVRSDRIEQLHGPSRWGVRLEFIGPIPPPEPGPDAVRQYTQAWVDELTEWVRKYPASWHMLQKVFTADLDPARLQRATGGAAEGHSR